MSAQVEKHIDWDQDKWISEMHDVSDFLAYRPEQVMVQLKYENNAGEE